MADRTFDRILGEMVGLTVTKVDPGSIKSPEDLSGDTLTITFNDGSTFQVDECGFVFAKKDGETLDNTYIQEPNSSDT
ncbi:MAG: hypothetical protein ACREHG_01890 [Candidatus Saccharimonadales bacterium]